MNQGWDNASCNERALLEHTSNDGKMQATIHKSQWRTQTRSFYIQIREMSQWVSTNEPWPFPNWLTYCCHFFFNAMHKPMNPVKETCFTDLIVPVSRARWYVRPWHTCQFRLSDAHHQTTSYCRYQTLAFCENTQYMKHASHMLI